jgi:hypothetical protein
MAKAKKEAEPVKEPKKDKTFIKSIAFPGLPIAVVGDKVEGDYIQAVAKLSKEDQAKYVS